MDIVLVIIRLIHIVAAALWAGAGVFSALILLPSLISLGAEASKMMVALGKNRIFTLIFQVSGGLTILAGLYLYLRSGASGNFTSVGWGVLSFGALAGIAAAIHGGILGRMTRDFMMQGASGSGSSADLASAGEKVRQHSRISLALVIIALVCMAAARYLG